MRNGYNHRRPIPHQSPAAQRSAADLDLLAHATSVLADVFEDGPFAVLNFAATSITDLGVHLERYLRLLSQSGIAHAEQIAAAMQWLITDTRPDVLSGPGVPDWLAKLDEIAVAETYVRPDDDQTSYVVGLHLPGAVGGFQARVDHRDNDALCNYFLLNDPAEHIVRILEGSLQDLRSYRPVAGPDALAALARGVERHDEHPRDPQPANPWPRNRAMLDFILRRRVDEG